MRNRLLTVLMVPFVVLPVVVIAAGGDLELLRHEIGVLLRLPIPMTVYAQIGVPSGGTMPSPPVGPIIPIAPVPTVSHWGVITLSILVALVALWYLTDARDRRPRPS